MYSTGSPVLGSLDRSHLSNSPHLHTHHLHLHQHHQQQQQQQHSPHLSLHQHHQTISSISSQCRRFKYFTTFLICTTCLALLSASLATHKWIVSKPIRILKLNGTQANLTSLMLTAQADELDEQRYNSNRLARKAALYQPLLSGSQMPSNNGDKSSLFQQLTNASPQLAANSHLSSQINNKFQGEIYFGLFMGVKVLNPGFGDRISSISVLQSYTAKDNSNQQELVTFKLWLLTLVSVVLAILCALVGSIFAIINFVMTPRGTLTGPVGLVIWNASACFLCLLAMISWLIEYFVHLQANVLTTEEVQNGWTSDKRSHFGYSYYLVVAAFVLHLVNIFVVSIVQFETWNSSKAAKRQSRAVCEGVIMLY